MRPVAGADTDALDECIANGVLVGAGTTVEFRHELIRHAVEQSISPVRRTELHARVLEALRGREETGGAARLAHHAAQAGLDDAVYEFAVQAGREAERVGAHADAARQYERALAHGEPGERERVELEVAFGYTAWLAAREREAERALADAVERAARLGDPVLQAHALTVRSGALWAMDRMAESREAQERAVALLEDGGDDMALARALSGLVRAMAIGADLEGALATAPRALELAKRVGSVEETIQIEISLALALGLSGDASSGPRLARCLEESRAAGLNHATLRSYVNGCSVAGLNRDHATIDALVPQAFAFFEAQQVTHPRDDVAASLARSLLDRGRYDDAIEWATAAQRTPHRERPLAATVEALARLRRGEPATGLEEEVEANDVYRLPLVCAARAEAAWLRGDVAAAREDLRTGFAVPGVEQCARAAGELALWAYRCGEPVPALPRLPEPVRLEIAGDWRAAIRAWDALDCPYDAALAAIAGDATAARRAAATLARLGARAAAKAFARERAAAGGTAPRGPRRSTLADPAGLTVREREVLARLAGGKTNREIAAALHLSERTVAHHVSSVLAKLGAATRTAAVGEARRRGLLAQDGPLSQPT